jgi:hypothetical protein
MTVTMSSDGIAAPATDKFGGAVIRVPALRQRREDIPDLVHETLRQPGAGGNRVSQRAMAALVGYRWPGNLRQLDAVVTAAAEAAGEATIELEHLPNEFRGAARRRRPLSQLQELERDAIAQALRESKGNKIQTAQVLGLSRSTLYRRLRYFGLDEDRTVLQPANPGTGTQLRPNVDPIATNDGRPPTERPTTDRRAGEAVLRAVPIAAPGIRLPHPRRAESSVPSSSSSSFAPHGLRR